MNSQAGAILLYLQSGRGLTALEALDLFACARLAARVKDLRRDGHDIETITRKENGKRFAEYRLRRPVQHEFFPRPSPGSYRVASVL